VSFCIAFGAGIALVGWYPKLAGTWGFVFVIIVVSASGAVAENTLHVTSIKTKASSFAELCAMMPSWMGTFTSLSMIAWGFTIAGLYVQYVFTFFNDQVLNDGCIFYNSTAGAYGGFGCKFEKEGLGAAGLYIPIGLAAYAITLPPKFSGNVVKVITNVNLFTTWVVIIFAIAKGFHMYFNTEVEDRPPEYEAWKPGGFLQVTVLLAGAMFQCSAVPRLQYEIQPDLRERAAWMIPLLLAVVQGVIFLIIGLIGYLALGACVSDDGNVFSSYRVYRNDWMVAVLQGGIALLMFLSLPLLGVPPKSELWGLLQAGKSREDKVGFENSPVAAQYGINAVMVVYAVCAPMLLGSVALTGVVTILAGTAANWLNLFLPCFVNIYANILPARAAGESYTATAAKSAWIFLLASMSLGSSLVSIYETFFGGEAAAAPPAPGYCEALKGVTPVGPSDGNFFSFFG